MHDEVIVKANAEIAPDVEKILKTCMESGFNEIFTEKCHLRWLRRLSIVGGDLIPELALANSSPIFWYIPCLRTLSYAVISEFKMVI